MSYLNRVNAKFLKYDVTEASNRKKVAAVIKEGKLVATHQLDNGMTGFTFQATIGGVPKIIDFLIDDNFFTDDASEQGLTARSIWRDEKPSPRTSFLSKIEKRLKIVPRI